MMLSLKPELQAKIDDRVRSGRYQTPEEVVAAALSCLDKAEEFGDFEPGELDQLIAEGENSGPPLDGEAVFAELRALRSHNQR